MKYSFVIIAYNESNNIAGCIRSILAQVGMGDDFEVLVVDDGSTDNTREIVTNIGLTNHHVRLISDGKNHGRGYGRYMGVTQSTGEFVIMVDADILLPLDWLVRSMPAMETYDVAGGIAVPDGDVAYVYRRFGLLPKVVMGTTTITGNNGIYRRGVFANVNFDPKLREGEDVDFNNRATMFGFREYTIPGLIVEHNEHKSFKRSMLWLYQSGIGATRQLHRFKKLRMPDLAFIVTVVSFILALILQIATKQIWWYLLPILGVIGVSGMHLIGKFELSLRRIPRFSMAVLTNAVFIFCYYLGRIAAYPRTFFTRSAGGSA